jgi:hypothetical protein
MPTILDIIDEVILESGRPDLEDNKIVIINWINRYKLALQRHRRFVFSENQNVPIVLRPNNRTSPLPSDYLFSIALKRQTAGQVDVSFDVHGNQIQTVREVILTRWLDREAFLQQFPMNKDDGQQYVGSVQDYIIVGEVFVWGPTPSTNESLYLDYFRKLPPYNITTNTEDGFTKYYHDGLFYRAMAQCFTSWIPDDAKRNYWNQELATAEDSLHRFEVSREVPMESRLEMSDT